LWSGGAPWWDIVEALAVPQGLYLGCIIACCMPDFPKIFLLFQFVQYSVAALRCCVAALLRIPDLLGDD
jgi:hypothetical protein